ncbi:MAG: hypothetical protein JRJ39_09650 [Deltaproteobacteria bacterium]|nr:hypothetical protein [Deltaproteobacteria bacterium]
MKSLNKRNFIPILAVFFFVTTLIPCMIYAVPLTINCQGYLRDSNNKRVNGTKNLSFRIYSTASGESPLWMETHSGETVTNGIFNVILGEASSIDPSIFNTSGDLWLGIKVDDDDEMTPRQKITSVAYAIMADSVKAPLALSGTGPVIKGTDDGSSNYGELGGSSEGVTGYNGNGNSGYLGGAYSVYGLHSNNHYGYLGGDSFGVYGYHNDGNWGYIGGGSMGVEGQNSNGNYGYLGGSTRAVYGYASSGNAGYFDGAVYVNGALGKASGTFVQPHAKDPSKEIRYAFFEGPEHAVFIRGTARLVDGTAVIELPEHFRVVAAKDGIEVQVTPYSAKTYGLAVVERSREKIVVKELREGRGSFEFSYYVTGVREGFETHEPVVANTHFRPESNETAGEFEARFSKDDMTMRAIKAMLISNGILTADGKLDTSRIKELGWRFLEDDASNKPATKEITYKFN